MSLNSIYGASQKLRFTGMASGIDTDAVIQSMMANQKAKLTRMDQSLKMSQYKKDALTEVNNQLRVFREKFTSALSGDSMLNRSSYYAYNITNDNTRAVAVTGNGYAKDAIHNIEILRLASEAKTESTESTGLTEAQVMGAMFDIAGMQSQEVDGDPRIAFKINDVTFNISANMSLDYVIRNINASDAGVTASFDKDTGKISMVSKKVSDTAEGDTKQQIKIENLLGNLFGTDSITKIGEVDINNSALVKIDGVEYERGTNKFTLDGLAYNLKKVTDPGQSVEFEVERNLQPTIDKIKGFVSAYNDLMASLNNMVTEKKVKGYPPLTDEMKAEMKDSDIAAWDKLTKQGLLSRDPDVTKLRDDMRNLFSADVLGMGSFAQFGIATGNYFLSSSNGGYSGKLEIDEAKLRTALTENPEKLVQMFTTAEPMRAYDSNLTLSQNDAADFRNTQQFGGLVQRVTSIFNAHTTKIANTSMSELNYSIQQTTSRMAEQTKIYQDKEDRLYAKFAAMETALSKLQSQSNWFSQQMGGSQG